MHFEETMENVARTFEVVGVVIIAIGGLLALLQGLRDFDGAHTFFKTVRRGFGRPLILGLEILVAADIIETITVEPTLASVAALGILVLVRVVLSFSLDIEVDGVLPWRRAETKSAGQANAGAG
jgi:uncharacterized membrane protein